MTRWIIGLSLALAAAAAGAQAGPAEAGNAPSAGAGSRPGRAVTVVASTPWTAAFARTAGVERVEVLAPYQMQHPPEYELKPSDVARVAAADLVIYAGYERSVKRLQEAVGSRRQILLRIATDHRMATIRESVRAIARAAGTEAVAEENLRKLESFFEDWRRELAASGATSLPALVHVMQRPLAEELGLDIVATFGPAPLEARQIAELSATRPALVIDNAHDPVAGPLRETVRNARFVELINFPQSEGKATLIDLLAEDRSRLAAALANR